MKAIIGFTCALILACFPLRAFAQGAGSVMQGAGSAAQGAAQQAGETQPARSCRAWA